MQLNKDRSKLEIEIEINNLAYEIYIELKSARFIDKIRSDQLFEKMIEIMKLKNELYDYPGLETDPF